MPINKLTIVPVSLDPQPTKVSTSISSVATVAPNCVIKTALAEISLFNGVDEHIIQTILRELKEQ